MTSKTGSFPGGLRSGKQPVFFLANSLYKKSATIVILQLTFVISRSPREGCGLHRTPKMKQEHEKHPENPWMFPSPKTGEMYHPDSIAKLHEKILRDTGLEHIRFHDLRHTFATMALQNGVDVKTVSSMLGHYDAGFTLRTYTHATRQMQEQAAEKMGNFMEQVM